MRYAIAVFSLVAILLALAPRPSLAQTSAFDLPTQPLAESLKAVGAKANLNVMVSPILVDGKQAPALKANLSAKDALAQVLMGSGLDYHFINDQTVVIREAGDKSAPDPAAERITSVEIRNTTKEGGKSSSQDFRVAQLDQRKNASDVPVDQSDKQTKESSNDGLEEIVV